MILSYWDSAYFQGLLPLREGNCYTIAILEKTSTSFVAFLRAINKKKQNDRAIPNDTPWKKAQKASHRTTSVVTKLGMHQTWHNFRPSRQRFRGLPGLPGLPCQKKIHLVICYVKIPLQKKYIGDLQSKKIPFTAKNNSEQKHNALAAHFVGLILGQRVKKFFHSLALLL